MRRIAVHLVAAVAATLLLAAAPASAAFDVTSYTSLFHEPVQGPVAYSGDPAPPLGSLPPARQAGAHADFTTEMAFAQKTNPAGQNAPDDQVREVEIDMPPGFYGDPRSVPACTTEQFNNGEGICPMGSQVGIAYVQITDNPVAGQWWDNVPAPVYNMTAPSDETAVLAFGVFGVPIKLEISARTGGDHGLTTTISNLNQALPVFATRVTLWGDPADSRHDPERVNAPGDAGHPSPVPVSTPFLSLPPRCDAPLEIGFAATSWNSGTRVERSTTLPALTGCDKLKLSSSLSLKPHDATADKPSGYDVDLTIDQDTSPDGLATPHLKDAVVTLPEGVAISPPSAHGLQGCADDRTGIGTTGEPTCPEAARIGTVSIQTHLLEGPLTGEIILREPKPGNLFRLLLVARGKGLVLKIPGDVKPDPVTGQIRAVFANTPQLPFSKLSLRFKGGSRAPLANPQTCGTKTTTSSLSSWGGPSASPSSAFDVVGCSGGMTPSFEAGSLNPIGGAFSPFTMTIRRPDGNEDIKSIALDMPPGLLGMIARVPKCPEAQAAAGACGAESLVGSTIVGAGAGDTPFHLPGKVFVAGPYKGAPFSLSIVVRAIAGPFDLGTVVVRAPLQVDAANAKIAVPSDPLPTILEGVPLRLRTINITIDRPEFMFNPTNCTPMQIGATVTGVGGAVGKVSVPYQARGCANLPLRPRLSLALTGKGETTDGKHPGIKALLTQQPGESGLKEVKVKLPLSLALDPDNAQALCKPEQATARSCPAGSIVGRATAVTPALEQPLTGPIYFVEATRRTASGQIRRTLPRLWLALNGEVPLDLWASSAVDGENLVTTFSMIPDAPISRFDLAIDGGRNGILAANTDICRARQITDVTFDGQNGRRTRSRVEMPTDCGFKVASASGNRTGVRVVTSGVGAGKITVSGKGLRKTTRRLRGGATVARVVSSLTLNGRRTLLRRKAMRTKVTVAFTPARGKTRRTSRVITVKR